MHLAIIYIKSAFLFYTGFPQNTYIHTYVAMYVRKVAKFSLPQTSNTF